MGRNPHNTGGGGDDHSGEWRRDEAGHWAEGEASELWTLIWGNGEQWLTEAALHIEATRWRGVHAGRSEERWGTLLR
jgi:hypothetical protein